MTNTADSVFLGKTLREKFSFSIYSRNEAMMQVSQAAEGLRYRIVQDECPEGFQKAEGTPNLEDVYLYWFKK